MSYLSAIRRRRQSGGSATPGLSVVPANVLAWVDFRQGGLEYVAGETEVSEGAPTWSASGASFDGTDDALRWTYGSTAFSSLPAGDFCLEMFGLSLANEAGSILGNDNDAGSTVAGTRGFQLYYRLSSPRLELYVDTNNGTVTARQVTAPPVDTPFHLCVERSGNNWTIYIDGVSRATWTLSGAMVNPARDWRIARRGSTDFKVMSCAAIRLTNGVRYGGAFTPPATPEYRRGALAGDYGLYLGLGARTWFNSPSMLVDGNRVLTPRCVDTGGSGITSLVEWNTDTGYYRQRQLGATPGGDDHNEGGALKTAAGTYLWLPWEHGATALNVYRGTDPAALSLADIGPQLDTVPNGWSFAYSNLIQLDGEANDPIYLFSRVNGGSNYMSRSLDDGVTWSAAVPWLTSGGQRPYPQFWKTSQTRFDFIATDGHPGEVVTSIWHGYFEGGLFYKSDGTLIGAAPIAVTSLTKVFDGTAANCWTWDLKAFGSEIVAAFSSFPTDDTHRYHRGVLSGGAWTVETVVNDAGYSIYGPTPVGQPHYSGGIAIASKDVMFASFPVSGVHHLHRVVRDGGGTWAATQLTTGSYKAFRPDVKDGYLTYVSDGPGGAYLSYTSFVGCRMMGVSL